MPMPSANGISIMDKEYNSPSNKKSIDELKRQVSKLKAELESERSKLKQLHRDKTGELKRIQENHEKERQKTIETVTKRLQNEHSVELRRIRESLTKEKDNELRQVLRFKDEELKAFKQQTQEEKDRAKRAEEDLKRHLTVKSNGNTNDLEKRLRNELSDIKEQKHKTDELYRLKCAADFEKAELIRRLKSEHEREINELIRQSKKEVAKEYHHLRSAEKALQEKNHELAFKDQLTRKLEAEKQEIRHRTSLGDINISESPLRSRKSSETHELTVFESSPEADDVFQLSSKGNKGKERELRKKNAELQSKLDILEKKCTFLEKENASKKTGSQKLSSVTEDKVKKLKKRNSELVSIARQLEEKAKKLQEEKNAVMKQANSKDDPSAEVEHMKRMFARQRAKDLAEHAKIHMEKDNELEKLREELASLSGAKSGAKNDKIGELQSIIKKTAKERLWLEKKLASFGSPCPSPLSPTPEGMNDLEKRLETYTKQAKTSEKEAEILKKELESKVKECEKLKQSAEEMTKKCSKLELEREKFAVKCTMLHQKNVELGKRIKEISQLEEQIKCLKENLQNAEENKQLAEQECQKLRVKLEELVLVKEELKSSEKQRKELEVIQQSSQYKLKEREEEIKQLHKIQEESTRAHRLAVTSLEQDLRKLEQKCADSDLRAANAKNKLESVKSRRSNEHKATQTSRPSSPVHMVKHLQATPHDRKKTDILNTAASRIKQLAMSDSEEDSTYSGASATRDTPKEESKHSGGGTEEDDIAALSHRISQAAISDDSSVSAADNNYDSDASGDVNSVAEGDMADTEDNDITASLQLADEEDTSTHWKTDGKGDENDVMDDRYLQQELTGDEEEETDNLSVYIARYSYDPFQHSPNDNPDAELAFQAGDYLYVFGDIDDDGFYLGELMDGQRGLVPSNFVEKIADESDMSWMTNGVEPQPTEDMPSSDEEERLSQTDGDDDECQSVVEMPPRVVKFSGKLHRNLRLNVEHIPDSKLCDIEEEDVTIEASCEALRDSLNGLTSDDTDFEPSEIPSPQRLILSRQFTRSILLNWKPADLPIDEIEGYTVYVNGELKVIIEGGHNTKALIEDIDPNETYRVSVRTVTTRGDESLDQEALLTIGKDASTAPTDVKVTDISPTSAKLEWLPSNSSFIHEILVNGTPRQTVTPGTRQLTLTNLEPSEHYRIHVRARNPSVVEEDDNPEKESLGETVEFTTQAAGFPDPPLNVHLVPTSSRSGPNTLEVSWIPVTITEQGMSNGAPVTGYKVYINDFAVAEVTSPTADCVTVASWMIERAAKKSTTEALKLVVKTQSSRGESVSSNYLSIPVTTFNFHLNKLIGTQPIGKSVKPKLHSSDVIQLDSGNEQEYQDDNHNLTNVKDYNEANDVNDVTYTEVIPKNADTRTPPVPKARDSNVNDVTYTEVIPKNADTRTPPVPKTRDSNVNDVTYTEVIPKNADTRTPPVSKARDSNVNDVTYTEVIPKNADTRTPPVPKTRDSNVNDGTYAEVIPKNADTRTPPVPKARDNNINEGTDAEVIPKNADTRTPPVPKARTKGKPVVWKMEVSEDDITSDSGDSNKGEHGGSSNNEEDEHVEICSPEPLVDEKTQQKEHSYKEETKKEYRDLTEKNLSDHAFERKMSEQSDIDMDELNDSLNSATSYKKDGKRHEKKVGNTEPFVYPLELSDSEVGNSSDEEPLSVIDEVEEIEEVENDVVEKNSSRKGAASEPERSRSSHSTSDSFKSDDDVMDLLGEEPEGSQERNTVTTANVRKISQETDDAALNQHYDGNQASLQKHLMSNVDGGDVSYHKHQTYSDIEADQPNQTSTPRLSRAYPDPHHQPMDQETTMGYENDDSDTEGNKTYTVSEKGEFPEEEEEEEEEQEEQEKEKEEEEEEQIRIFIALYDYDPTTMSPNSDAEEDELTFHEGDLIKIYGDKDEDGFYWGELESKTGFVPHNMVSEVQVDEEDLLDQTGSSLAETYSNNVPDHKYESNDSPDHKYESNASPDVKYQSNDSPDHKYQSYASPDLKYQSNDSSDHKYQQPEGQSSQYPKVVVHHAGDTEDDTEQDDSYQPEQDMNYMPEQDEEEIGYEDPRTSMNYSLKPKKMVALFDYDPQILSPNPDSEVELRFRAGDFIYVYGEMDEDGFFTGEQGGVRGLVPSNFLEDIKETSSPPYNEQENSFTSQENSESSFVGQESPAPGPSKTPNGANPSKEESHKKKKGLLSKGKQMLKKMTKSQASKR